LPLLEFQDLTASFTAVPPALVSKCYRNGSQIPHRHSLTLHQKVLHDWAMRTVALIALMLGALGSFGLMLRVGHYQLSVLMLLFTIWDLSPFLALISIDLVSKHWAVFHRTALYVVMLVVAVGSVTIYASVVLRAPAQPAFAFLVVPLASWVLLILVVLIGHVVSRRMSGRDEPLFRL
jgi:hypothetical protein